MLKRKSIELWICYSSISYFLFIAWQRERQNRSKGFFCLAPTSPLNICKIPNKCKDEITHALQKYCNQTFILLTLRSLLKGRKLIIRIPHLNSPIPNNLIKKLYSLNLINLELYDDGFLGILDSPAVCKYMNPIFRSICCWNITNWNLSNYVLSHIQSKKIQSIDVVSLPCSHVIDQEQSSQTKTTEASIIIIEAKYMDYLNLAKIVINTMQDISSNQVPLYYQHYWSIKRNALWPDGVQRRIVRNMPVERDLSQLVNSESHVITGMTSSVVFLCELVKQGLVPMHKVTLLLQESIESTDYHNDTELSSFIGFMCRTYYEVIDLTIILNGVTIEPKLSTNSDIK